MTFGLKPINHSLCAHARFLFPVNLVSHASIKISWLFAASLFLCLSLSLSHTDGTHTRCWRPDYIWKPIAEQVKVWVCSAKPCIVCLLNNDMWPRPKNNYKCTSVLFSVQFGYSVLCCQFYDLQRWQISNVKQQIGITLGPLHCNRDTWNRAWLINLSAVRATSDFNAFIQMWPHATKLWKGINTARPTSQPNS